MLQERVLIRLITQEGLECVFYRRGENKYHEATEQVEVCRCKGLFHWSDSYLGVTLLDAGKITAEKQPMLLILPADIQKGDRIEMAHKSYEVAGIDDPGNLGICLDLSLREAI